MSPTAAVCPHCGARQEVGQDAGDAESPEDAEDATESSPPPTAPSFTSEEARALVRVSEAARASDTSLDGPPRKLGLLEWLFVPQSVDGAYYVELALTILAAPLLLLALLSALSLVFRLRLESTRGVGSIAVLLSAAALFAITQATGVVPWTWALGGTGGMLACWILRGLMRRSRRKRLGEL